MTVAKRVLTKGKNKKKHKAKSTNVSLELPTELKLKNDNLAEFTTMIYGRAGIGKTTFFANIPGTLMLSCERISEGIACFDFNYENGGCKDWIIIKEAIKLLTKTKHQFTGVCFDTVDAAWEHCQTYVCEKLGCKHPGEKDDFGATWKAVKTEFNVQISKLKGHGIAVYFTSHSKEINVKPKSGESYNKVMPTCTGATFATVRAITDLMLYAEYVKDIKGRSRRILITQGDEIIEAKSPPGIPMFLPLELDNGYDILAAAFAGEYDGIPVSELFSSKLTSETIGTFLKKEKVAVKRNVKRRTK